MSKSSLSLWLRDVALTEEHRAALAQKQRDAVQRRADSIRAAARAREARMIDEAAAQIESFDTRDLFVAGVVAYWAEGSKTKPWGPRPTDLSYRVNIHESADVSEALSFWSGVVGTSPARFQKTSLKRHNPRTIRKNVGEGYVGCLEIGVRRSSDLNSRINGWFHGIIRLLSKQEDGSMGGP